MARRKKRGSSPELRPLPGDIGAGRHGPRRSIDDVLRRMLGTGDTQGPVEFG
jgi:hypothetical protein